VERGYDCGRRREPAGKVVPLSFVAVGEPKSLEQTKTPINSIKY
jgi:hypothetical protein